VNALRFPAISDRTGLFLREVFGQECTMVQFDSEPLVFEDGVMFGA
jgi:hypothetical protein